MTKDLFVACQPTGRFVCFLVIAVSGSFEFWVCVAITCFDSGCSFQQPIVIKKSYPFFLAFFQGLFLRCILGKDGGDKIR
jgi:hypothetical protein